MSRKIPLLASILSIVMGPIGYWYIGWKFAVASFFAFILIGSIIAIWSVPFSILTIFISLIIVGLHSFYLAKKYNIESSDPSFNNSPEATLSGFNLFTWLLINAVFWAGATLTYQTFNQGEIILGFAYLAGTIICCSLSYLVGVFIFLIALGLLTRNLFGWNSPRFF